MIIHAIIWILVLGLSFIPGILIGSLIEGLLGHWAYWPGYIIGTIAYLITMSPILFLDKDIPVPEGGDRSSRSVMPFLLGIWAGSRMRDK